MDIQTIKKLEKQIVNAPIHPVQDLSDYRDTWRIFRIMAELVEGYQFLAGFKKEVTLLGSARTLPDSEHFKIAKEVGFLLGKSGFTVITGGGPGVMQAANQGAFEAGAESVGLNIQLPFEQRINPYVNKSIAFYYFFTRKVMLTSPANAFVVMPGGFGTMDEFFEIVDLIELGLMKKVPIVLVGKDYWQPLISFVRLSCAAIGSIEADDIASWHLVDTAKEAHELIKDVSDENNVCELSANSFHCQGKIDWKIFRVMAELVEGFEFLTGMSNAVTILGTKSITHDDPYYEEVRELSQKLAEAGFTIVTGGKFGVAEAANKGAFEVGGQSIGIGMRLREDGKKDMNSYLTKSISFNFPFTRKLIITAPTSAFVFFPGGYGTLHQLFEVLTLIQTKKIKKRPVLLVDHKFWLPLQKFIKEVMVHDLQTIGNEDDELYQVVDNCEAALKIIKEAVVYADEEKERKKWTKKNMKDIQEDVI